MEKATFYVAWENESIVVTVLLEFRSMIANPVGHDSS